MEITQEKMKSIIREDFIMDDDNTLLGFVECENKLGEYQAGETYVIYFAGDETEINCHPIRDMYRHVMETQEEMKSAIRADFEMDSNNTLLGFMECESKIGEYQAGETYVVYFAGGDEAEINCHPIRDMYRHVMEKQAETKTYRIDECLLVQEKLLPRGFDLHISEASAEIIVPSDVPGDGEPLYTEEIPLSQRIFRATYVDGNPVHAEDGELIGNEA